MSDENEIARWTKIFEGRKDSADKLVRVGDEFRRALIRATDPLRKMQSDLVASLGNSLAFPALHKIDPTGVQREAWRRVYGTDPTPTELFFSGTVADTFRQGSRELGIARAEIAEPRPTLAVEESSITAELPAQVLARPQAESTTGDPIATERHALYDTLKADCKSRGVRITHALLAQAANPSWHDRTPVMWWLANDSRSTPIHNRLIRAALTKLIQK